jgi:hypothetical protein
MHDLLEGVAKYVLSFIIVTFVDTYKYFSLETLNERIMSFPYEPDLKNKPCDLQLNHFYLTTKKVIGNRVSRLDLPSQWVISNLVKWLVPTYLLGYCQLSKPVKCNPITSLTLTE